MDRLWIPLGSELLSACGCFDGSCCWCWWGLRWFDAVPSAMCVISAFAIWDHVCFKYFYCYYSCLSRLEQMIGLLHHVFPQTDLKIVCASKNQPHGIAIWGASPISRQTQHPFLLWFQKKTCQTCSFHSQRSILAGKLVRYFLTGKSAWSPLKNMGRKLGRKNTFSGCLKGAELMLNEFTAKMAQSGGICCQG